MGIAAILFNNAKPFEQTVNTPLIEGSFWNLVKVGLTVSEKKFKDCTILYVYSPGASADNPHWTKFWVSLNSITKLILSYIGSFKCFTTLIIHCKFQPLVSNTFWENLSTFYTYKCMGMQIWSCHKNIKGQTTTIIWTNFVDLESLIIYKIQH